MPATALMAAEPNETSSVSLSAATASGAEMTSQKLLHPPCPAFQTMAAIGISTITLR